MFDVRGAIFGMRSIGGVLSLALLVVLTGCQGQRPSPHGPMRLGQFAEARDLVESQVVDDRSDRRYMLDRMRAGVLNLDAGDPERAERWFAEVYDVLRIQGLNADKTVSSIVLTEGVKVWKGEPFEQAMALVYYGYVQASLGSWDNARAAAGNALFYLRDFDAEEEGEAGGEGADSGDRLIDTEEIARRAAAYEKQQSGDNAAGDSAFESGDEYLDHGYVAEQNNFTMAYLLHAIASQQLGRDNEASDYYNRALSLSPALRPLIDQLRAGQYNTIVVVADGLGPRKIATGPGGAISRYQPIDKLQAPAQLLINGQPNAPLATVTDLNQMALDHRWNNLEDVRLAKNLIGDVLIGGGVATLAIGANQDSETAMIVGGAAILAGALLKATSRANTDYCDVFPQRIYVAALQIDQPVDSVTVEMSGFPTMRATLRNLDPPTGPQAAFYYLRAPVDRDLKAPEPLSSDLMTPPTEPGSLP